MCVAYPGRVLCMRDKTAEVDFGGNVVNVRIGLVDVKEGDYVLAHAGIAIEVVSEIKARSILEVWEQLEEV